MSSILIAVGILFEKGSRIPEIAMVYFPRLLEGMINENRKLRKLPTQIPYASVSFFSLKTILI